MKQLFSNKLIFGLAVLGFASLAFFWFFISAIFLDEAGVDLTPAPPVSTSSENGKVAHMIFVNASDEIFVDDEALDIEELNNLMSSKFLAGESQRVILRVDTDAKHSILVEIKDTLDELNYNVLLELVDTSEDGPK